jgi:hypothetical protein
MASRIPTSASFLRGKIPMDECPCIIPDENFNCVDFGKHIDMSDAEPPDLGDIGGICKLIDATAKTYARLVRENTDPGNPRLTRLRMVGGTMVRIPHKAILKNVLGPSYVSAKALGYRGTFERWGDLVWEAVPPAENPAEI